MTVDEIAKLVRDTGAPIGMLIWFMWRLEKKIDRAAEVMAKLHDAIMRGADQ